MPTSVQLERIEYNMHRQFWLTDDRYDKLRSIAIHLQKALRFSDRDLFYDVSKILPDQAVSLRTISRFCDENDRSSVFNGDIAPFITALCRALYELCRVHGGDLPQERRQTVDELSALRKLTVREFPDFPIVPHGKLNKRKAHVLRDNEISKGKLIQILNGIHEPHMEDDPKWPEFPPNSPRFPATPMEQIQINDFTVFVKDESRNPNGCHKDRWAWEQLLLYKKEIRKIIGRRRSMEGIISVPQLSMISAGTAAFALQSLLKVRDLPPLRVLMDADRTDPRIIAKLKSIGAIVYSKNLDKAFLSSDDVLNITENPPPLGIDITTRDVTTPQRRRFYDWLVCELLVYRPSFVFVPFGTGDLFANIILFLEKLRKGREQLDSRVPPEIIHDGVLDRINVLGAITDNPNTRMDKLYAAYRPTMDSINEKIVKLKMEGILGDRSGIFPVLEKWTTQAEEIATKHNICTEPSGIAGLSLFLQMKKYLRIDSSDRIVVVNTGWMHLPAGVRGGPSV